MVQVTIAVLCFAMVTIVWAKPATNNVLDKATINDVAANSVSPDKTVQKVEASNVNEKKESVSVQIFPTTEGSFKDEIIPTLRPHTGTSVFSRLIDDIFQIPISVLQSVARLLTNPFTQIKKNQEAHASQST